MNSVAHLKEPTEEMPSASSLADLTPQPTPVRSEAKASDQRKAESTKRIRDPRLDFFRGVGMLIILLAHIPSDGWALWIPARFGFSDATETFVFQSGMASAIAFGATYDRSGALILVARIAQRIWQIFWAHIAVFITVTAIMVVAGSRYDGVSYVDSLNLVPFMNNPGSLLVGLLTLTYVPNYFDILPMYIVILALMPVMIIASRMHRVLPYILMFGLWLASQYQLTPLPAEPWSDRPWFFNPFGWQLVFFTGFFLMRGDIFPPPPSKFLTALAMLFVLLCVPFALVRFQEYHPFFHGAAVALQPFTDKTNFGILRFIHFLALCYIAVQIVGERGARLRGLLVRMLIVVGQQSLAVFVTGMVIAQIIGIALDHVGRTSATEAAFNLLGFGTLITVAYVVRWFKRSPWKS